MQHFMIVKLRTKFARTLFASLFLCFALVSFGCVTGKNQTVNTEFEFNAETIPEGILITFSNIPSDAIRIFVSLYYFENDEITSSYNIVSSYADIRDKSAPQSALPSFQMEKVKQTGKIIYPFVQTGQKYFVSAFVFNKQNLELLRNGTYAAPVTAAAECIAENGININGENVMLELNKTKTAVTLLSEPEFSPNVIFDTKKYDFNIHIKVDEKGSIGVGTHHLPGSLSSDGLTWSFEPQMSEDLKVNHRDWLENGINYSAWAEARAKVIYDDIIWSVEIGKTKEFNFSL